jgi:glucose-1-phosphate thymidylyltransferase
VLPSIAAKFERPPAVIIDYLLGALQRAGIRNTLVVTRAGKWDIPEYLGNGDRHALSVAYVVLKESAGVPWTIDAAFPFVCDKIVTLGFPDMLFQPLDLFARLLDRLNRADADVALAVLPADKPHKVDIVVTGRDDTVLDIQPKPEHVATGSAWIAAVWRPTFSSYLHQFLMEHKATRSDRELYPGDVIRHALSELRVIAVPVPSGRFLDIGTPDDMARAGQEW